MSAVKAEWEALAAHMIAARPGVAPGKMMSADALTWRGKVFAFHTTKGGMEGLGCRIGRDHDISGLGLTEWRHLAPFRTKPPMKDWIVVGPADLGRWREVAAICLTKMQEAA